MTPSLFDEAQRCLQQGEFAQAKVMLEGFLAQHPGNLAGVILLGMTLIFLNEYGAACEYLRSAELARPDDPLINFYLAQACKMMGQVDQAIAGYQKVPSDHSLAADAHHALVELNLPPVLSAIDQFEKAGRELVTIHLRPIQACFHGLNTDAASLSADFAIVIQGPLLHESNFTLESVRLYRRLYPYAGIIVSTWEEEPDTAIIAFEQAGAIVLRNAKPSKSGPSNINMQICSALAGIRYAEQQGYRYALKTRSDFRIYSPSFLVNALSLLDAFPLHGNSRQKARLLAFSDIVKYMPYCVPDKNMFGTVADMLDYWSPPYDERTDSPPDALMDLARFGVAESYLLCNYMKVLGRRIEWTQSDSWAIFRDHFVFMDQSAADIYWHKYQRQREYRWKSYDQSTTFQEFGFFDWLRIYQGKVKIYTDDRIGQLPGGTPIAPYWREQ